MAKIRFALCTVDLKTNGAEVQLLPAGDFTARDGRPGKGRKWHIDCASAAKLIQKAAARSTPFVIDYEHQTLHAEANGKPAPAAGWFKTMEFRQGDGLYAVDVAWTDAAKAMIAAGEYKFISPVFAYGQDGTALELHMAALTNYPAIDGMQMLAAARFQTNTEKEDTMLKKLLALLGLAESDGEDEVIAAVTALKTDLDRQKDAVAALKAKPPEAPDPAKYVPVETVTALQAEVAALKGTVRDRQVDELIASALSDGRILPAMESWARELGKKDVAALKGYIEAAQPIAALCGMQTGGKAPAGSDKDGLDDTARAVCKAMDINAEDYKKTAA